MDGTCIARSPIQRKECTAGTIIVNNDCTNNNAYGYKMKMYDKCIRGDTTTLTRTNQENHLWLTLERYNNHAKNINNTNSSPNNIGHASLSIAKGVSDTPDVTSSLLTLSAPVPATSANTFDTDQPKPVSDFVTEKPTEFNPFVEEPKVTYFNNSLMIWLFQVNKYDSNRNI